jgi:hypothetical protein
MKPSTVPVIDYNPPLRARDPSIMDHLITYKKAVGFSKIPHR